MDNELNSMRWLNFQFPWILMMGLITLQSQLSGAMLGPALAPGLDKAIHFFIFGVLGWLMARGLSNSARDMIRNNYLWLILLFALSFATVDELHQSMVPGRYLDVWDWLADVFGIIVFMLWYKKRNAVKV